MGSVVFLAHNSLAEMVNLFVKDGPIDALVNSHEDSEEFRAADSQVRSALNLANIAITTLRGIAEREKEQAEVKA